MENDGIILLCCYFDVFSNLEVLDLSSIYKNNLVNGFNEIGFEEIKKNISKLESLESLIVGGNRFGLVTLNTLKINNPDIEIAYF